MFDGLISRWRTARYGAPEPSPQLRAALDAARQRAPRHYRASLLWLLGSGVLYLMYRDTLSERASSVVGVALELAAAMAMTAALAMVAMVGAFVAEVCVRWSLPDEGEKPPLAFHTLLGALLALAVVHVAFRS